MSLTSECIVVSESFVLVIEWQYVANCERNRRAKYDDDADDDDDGDYEDRKSVV